MTETTKTNSKNKHCSLMGRKLALAKLGLAAAVVYAAPMLGQLDPAHASGGGGWGGGGGSGAVQVATDPTTVTECGECHMAYSPRYLPAGSWNLIMRNLADHYGEDASGLDAATMGTITNYLTRNAGGNGGGANRITDTRWFRGSHGGEARFTQDRPPYKCEACHAVPGQNNQRGGGGWWGR